MKCFTLIVFLLLAGGEAFAQQGASTSQGASAQQGTSTPPRKVPTLVDSVTVMPYLTGSYNIFSGQAFYASASGLGIGGGITFDLTKQGQKMGFMFDFAFQDMTGVAQNGSSLSSLVTGINGVSPSANAYQYWDYLLFEPFLKLQTNSKRTGYFMIGASFGFAVLSETVNTAPGYPSEYQDWDGTPFGNRFRFDLRAGVGVELAKIGNHSLMLEARAGYPITNELNDGNGNGDWRIITIQVNVGLRI